MEGIEKGQDGDDDGFKNTGEQNGEHRTHKARRVVQSSAGVNF